MLEHLPKRLWAWWESVTRSGERHGVDPYLILGILDRESLGGEALRPKGQSGVGDGGHGKGLMQIDERYHPDFCTRKLASGSFAWADGPTNIDYGAQFLRGLLEHFMHRPNPEPLAVASYNADQKHVDAMLLEMTEPSSEERLIRALDDMTTGHNYVSDVLARRDRFRRLMAIPLEAS